MDILLFGGQSNMHGQTEACPEKIPVDGALEYRFLQNTLIPLCHPVGENIGNLLEGADQGRGSLIPDFCREYIEKSGKKVTAVPVAYGATTISQWLPEDSKGAHYMLLRKAKDAIRAVKERGESVEKIYMIWLQGESDAIASTDAETYKARVRRFRDILVKEVGIDDFCFIRVGKFVGDERDLVIIRAQEELSHEDGFDMITRVTGVCTQDTAKYINPSASGHYNNAAMELIGKSAGANLARIRLGQPVMLEDEPYDELK